MDQQPSGVGAFQGDNGVWHQDHVYARGLGLAFHEAPNRRRVEETVSGTRLAHVTKPLTVKLRGKRFRVLAGVAILLALAVVIWSTYSLLFDGINPGPSFM